MVQALGLIDDVRLNLAGKFSEQAVEVEIKDVSKERIKWGNGFSLNTLSNKEIYDKCELLIADGNKRKKITIQYFLYTF